MSRKIEQAKRAEPPLESIVQSAQELNPSRSRAPKTDSDFEKLLTPKETAQFLRVSESWLAKARMRGDGPPYLLFGRVHSLWRGRAGPVDEIVCATVD